MQQTYCVYKHTFPDGKVYIGMTGQKPEERWRKGQGYDRKATQTLYQAILSAGWDNIKHEIIADHLNEYEARRQERECINIYHSYDEERGYNRLLGGEKKKHDMTVTAEMERFKKQIKRHYDGFLGMTFYPPINRMLKDFPPDFPTDGNEDVLSEIIKKAQEIIREKAKPAMRNDESFFVWLYTKKLYETFCYLSECEGKETAKRLMRLEF